MNIYEPAHLLREVGVAFESIPSIHVIALLGALVSRGSALVLPTYNSTRQITLTRLHTSLTLNGYRLECSAVRAAASHTHYLSFLGLVLYTGRPVPSSTCKRSAISPSREKPAKPPFRACACGHKHVENSRSMLYTHYQIIKIKRKSLSLFLLIRLSRAPLPHDRALLEEVARHRT